MSFATAASQSLLGPLGQRAAERLIPSEGNELVALDAEASLARARRRTEQARGWRSLSFAAGIGVALASYFAWSASRRG